MKTLLVVLISIVVVESSMAQVGRENGNTKIPLFVSHIPRANQAMLHRKTAPHHNIFNKIICFEIKCRNIVGWQKRQVGTSFAKYKKQIRKNAEKGAYKSLQQKPPRKDSIPVVKPDSVPLIAKVQEVGAPPMRADSLIILSENELLFETNSFKLNGEHLASLDSITVFLLRYPFLEAEISGHTDNTGAAMHNVRLSTQRAEAVAQYVINKGISTDRVAFEGYGDTKPIAANDTEFGRRKNRRVEILLHDKR